MRLCACPLGKFIRWLQGWSIRSRLFLRKPCQTKSLCAVPFALYYRQTRSVGVKAPSPSSLYLPYRRSGPSPRISSDNPKSYRSEVTANSRHGSGSHTPSA